jgi:hypothetical protein
MTARAKAPATKATTGLLTDAAPVYCGGADVEGVGLTAGAEEEALAGGAGGAGLTGGAGGAGVEAGGAGGGGAGV